MLNVIRFSGNVHAVENLQNVRQNLESIFSLETLEKLEAIRDKEIDNIIIRDLPVPDELAETPKEIHGSVPSIFPAYLLEILGNYFGEVSEKGIENSIRFPTGEEGSVNVETWHGHPQFSYSVFFCLRGDKNAKTYFLSANDIAKHATEEERGMLLSSGLIKQTAAGYEFSEDIYQPSDFQQYIENLDLPDTTKALNVDKENEAFRYLLKRMIGAEDMIVYQLGDIAIYNERQTMRFSSSYLPTTKKGEERWLLGVGVY